MKRLRRMIGSLILLIISVSNCSNPPLQTVGENWVDEQLKGLSLREKIAQMMIYHMSMNFINHESRYWKETKSLIESDGIGGIHIYYGEPGMSFSMQNELQQMSRVPILFDGDLEYGLEYRYKAGTDLPPLMAIAATGDPHYAYLAGEITAREATAVGIHWNFSPVVDVNNNPANPIINTRAFGEDPELVSKFAVQYIKGLQDNGMLATAKHFPGHGDTATDSHTSLAEIPSDSLRLWTIELKPFQAAIDAGVDAVMVSHLQAPDFQPHARIPATLSPFWIQDILRGKMKFDGVVVTDAMGMGGLTQNFTDRFALIEAINAGCDVIITRGDYRENINMVEAAVKDGIIPEDRINEAARRMLALKQKAGLDKRSLVDAARVFNELGTRESADIAAEIAQKSVTLVKYDVPMIPILEGRGDTLIVVDLYGHEFDHDQSRITRTLERNGIPLKSMQIDESDPEAYIQFVLDRIPAQARVVINAFSVPKAWRNEIYLKDSHSRFIRDVAARTDRLLVNSLGNPYIIQSFPEIPDYLCAYKNGISSQQAVASALLGEAPISGILPVTIPNVARAGFGIQLPKYDAVKSGSTLPLESVILKRAMPQEAVADISKIVPLLQEAIADSAWPGCVLLAARDGKIFIHEAQGYHTYQKQDPTRRGDIFDLASVTKVIATTSSIMKLTESDMINLDDPVDKYVPEFQGHTPDGKHSKSEITIRHLLTHSAGLPPFKQFYRIPGTVQTRIDSVLRTNLLYPPGDTTVYSDIGLITLGILIQRVSGLPLDVYSDNNFFKPLGMTSTYFNPPQSRLKRIVPTEYSQIDGHLVHGVVHDENSESMDGVTGHAGLFSTAYDLAIFSQMMLNHGRYRDAVIFQPWTVDLFTKRAEVIQGSSRCLGWDSPEGRASGGVYLSDTSFGHTGFTGTSLWIDPENQVIVVLLTNAVHPDRSWKRPKYFAWRQRIHSAVYESLGFTKQNPNLEWVRNWK